MAFAVTLVSPDQNLSFTFAAGHLPDKVNRQLVLSRDERIKCIPLTGLEGEWQLLVRLLHHSLTGLVAVAVTQYCLLMRTDARRY